MNLASSSKIFPFVSISSDLRLSEDDKFGSEVKVFLPPWVPGSNLGAWDNLLQTIAGLKKSYHGLCQLPCVD